MEDFDIRDFALPEQTVKSVKIKAKLPRHQLGEKFLKGPIPLNWVCMAAQLPGKSFQVAMAIWFLAGLHKTPTVKLQQSVLTTFGVSRQCKYRALEWLAEAKLIVVEKSNGKSPIVTILPAPESAI